MIGALLRWFARASPVAGWRDPDVERALAALGTDIDSPLVTAATTGIVTGTVALSSALVVFPGATPAAAIAVVGFGLAYATYRGPAWLAAARRVRALGDAPDLVARATLRLRIEPTPEGAAAFAARASDPLAVSLREHVAGARGTPRSGWQSFADEWADWNRSLARSVRLLDAAADAPDDDRARLLDRAVSVVLEGTREDMAQFAAAIEGPTTGLYAFGVVLPLALVGVLPAAGAAGIAVGGVTFVAVYDLLLPAALVGASGWLLGRRPVAFRSSRVSQSHPDLPAWRRLAVPVALVAGVIAWLVAPVFLPPWLRWIVAPGVTAGIALAGWFWPVVVIRRRTRAVEAGLPDAVSLVGHRLREGTSVEAAVAAVGEDLDGATGEAFARAAGVQRRLRVSVRDAFVGEHGALAAVPSPRARALAALIALAGREGAHGGRLLVEYADHLDDLVGVERAARRDVASVTGTLRHTALLFGPFIAGATVTLADRLQMDAPTGATDSFGTAATTLDPTTVGVAVGAYVLLLAVVLSGLAVGLERGLDRALVGYHAGVALLAASLAYPTAVVATGLLV